MKIDKLKFFIATLLFSTFSYAEFTPEMLCDDGRGPWLAPALDGGAVYQTAESARQAGERYAQRIAASDGPKCKVVAVRDFSQPKKPEAKNNSALILGQESQSPSCEAAIREKYATYRMDKYGNQTGQKIFSLQKAGGFAGPGSHNFGNNNVITYMINVDRFENNEIKGSKVFTVSCVVDLKGKVVGVETKR